MPGKVVRPPFVPFTVPTHGTRTPKHIVLHDTEGGGTVESLAAYFRNNGQGLGVNYIIEANGRMGSLGNFLSETWHVASHNSECIGIEQMGFASTSRVGWFRKIRQLWAACWVVAWIAQEMNIPIRRSAANRHWTASSGVCQHSDVPDNDHNDCGPNYPFGWILETAEKWRVNGVPAWVRIALPKS
jgi:hypothetical protein